MRRSSSAVAVIATFLVLVTSSCEDEVTAPDTGAIEVWLTMSGVELDPDGGSISCDGEMGRMLVPDVPVSFLELPQGNHHLWLSGLTGNCTALNNPRTVSVSAGQTVEEMFAVVCEGPDPRLDVSRVAVAMVPDAWQAFQVWATDAAGAEDGWTAVIDDGSIASLSVSGNQVTVTGESFGEATITVTSNSGIEVNVAVTVYNPMVLDVGDLLITYVDEFELRGWIDWGPPPDTWWHPVTQDGWKALGSLMARDYSGPADGKFWMMVVKEDGVTGALAPPEGFVREGWGQTIGDDLAGTWYTPICPAGYVALGTVLGKRSGNTAIPPTTDDVTCVREDLTFDARVDPSTAYHSDRTPEGQASGFWQITIPQLSLHEDAFLEVGTFLFQGPEYTCTGILAGAQCWEDPLSHPVLHVLAVDLPMIIDTPESTRVPALTGFDQPPVEAIPTATKTMLVPFTALLGGTDFGGADVHWMVHNSPTIQVERVIYNRLMYHGINNTSVLQENSLEFVSGVSTTDSETFSHTAGVSITVESGVEFFGSGGSVSMTVSYEFGYESMHSVTSLRESHIVVTIYTAPGKAAAAWQQRNAYRVKRHRGTELDVVGELEFGMESYVVDEYPDEN
ncbi:MAG TPA: Vps62-related protein [Gemmatimonadota bacterium]|nr:Vps62-related protein [Gemmatimonadota bacterium]